MIINVLARDADNIISTLRKTVEAIVPFWLNVTVVVFENDSVDKTRDMFKSWSKTAEGYNVDLIGCKDLGSEDCKLKTEHRYGEKVNLAAGLDNLARFRNHLLDYVLRNESYANYSHMLVTDLDLGISLSPLGILHSIGSGKNVPIAVVYAISRGL